MKVVKKLKVAKKLKIPIHDFFVCLVGTFGACVHHSEHHHEPNRVHKHNRFRVGYFVPLNRYLVQDRNVLKIIPVLNLRITCIKLFTCNYTKVYLFSILFK